MNESEIIFNVGENDTSSSCKDSKDYIRIFHFYMLTIGSSFVILMGTFGNVATFCVFRKKAYKTNIMANMFRYLSVLDLIFLWTAVTHMFANTVWGVSLIHSVTRLCPFMAFWVQTLLSLANWMLVVITVSRLVYIKFPFSKHTLCSKLNYTILLVTTHVFVIGIFGGNFVYVHMHITEQDYQTVKTCYQLIGRPSIQPQLHRVLYLITNFAGPAIVLVITNAFIINELRHVKTRRERLFGSAKKSSSRFQSKENTDNRVTDNMTSNDLDRTANACRDTSSIVSDYNLNAKVDGNGVVLGSSTGRKSTDIDHHLGSHVGTVSNQTIHDVMRSTSRRSWRSSLSGTYNPSRPSWVGWISDARSHCVDMEFGETDAGPQRQTGPFNNTLKASRTSNTDIQSAAGNSEVGVSQEDRGRALTVMLVTASAVFLVLNTPFWVMHLYGNELFKGAYGCESRKIIVDIAFLLRYSNNSINFIFYCAIGRRFRHEFITWFKNILPSGCFSSSWRRSQK